MCVTLVASLALAEGVGLGAEGAGGTGFAVAGLLRDYAGLGQECPCRDSRVTGSTATWSNAPAVPRCAVPCHTDWAALTCGTRTAATASSLDPVRTGGAPGGDGMSPQAEEWLHKDPLPLGHGAVPPPWGLQFAGRQPQRCQGHLQAGREQGCRQPGCSRSWAPVAHTSLYRRHSRTWNCVETGACTGQHGWSRGPLPQSRVGVLPQGREYPVAAPCALLSPQYTSKQLPAGTVGATVPQPVQGAVPPCALQMVLPGWH